MGGGGVLPSPPLESPSSMPGFRQTGACVETSRTLDPGTRRVPRARSFPVLEIPGETLCPAPAACPVCGGRTRPNGATSCRLAHLPFGGSRSVVTVYRPRARRTRCGAGVRAPAPFRAPGRTATPALVRPVGDLPAYGLTLTDVALATGLRRQVVRETDRERLARPYTRPTPDGRREPSPPAARSRPPGVDEFKLHDGHRYATVVLDPESGHVPWLARGERRPAPEGFFDLACDEWMGGAEAVACDMNSDHERAFRERYPHAAVVSDRFHLVGNLNENAIGEVRKDLQREPVKAGDQEGARRPKRTKYPPMASRPTREQRERRETGPRGPSEKQASLFRGEVRPRWQAGPEPAVRHRELVASNELLFAADLVKDTLSPAHESHDPRRTREPVEHAAGICHGTGDRHFAWFARLLESHMDGIRAHALHPVTSGKVEGTNNMIKTLRRKHYGLPDDEYLFLKIMDASRKKQRWQPPPHPSTHKNPPRTFCLMSFVIEKAGSAFHAACSKQDHFCVSPTNALSRKHTFRSLVAPKSWNIPFTPSVIHRKSFSPSNWNFQVW